MAPPTIAKTGKCKICGSAILSINRYCGPVCRKRAAARRRRAKQPKTSVSYTRLPSGEWGVRGAGLVPGNVVLVGKKFGGIEHEVIDQLIAAPTSPDGTDGIASILTRGGQRDQIVCHYLRAERAEREALSKEIVGLAQSALAGEDCLFALHDAMLEAGQPDLAKLAAECKDTTDCPWLHDLAERDQLRAKIPATMPAEIPANETESSEMSELWAISGNPKNKKRAWIEERPGRNPTIRTNSGGALHGASPPTVKQARSMLLYAGYKPLPEPGQV